MKIGFWWDAVNEKTFQVDRKHALQTLLVAIKADTGSDHCESAQNCVPATLLVNDIPSHRACSEGL